jgi:anti-anti-sigma regulatory factor
MWKMEKVKDRNWVVLRICGHLEAEHLVEMQNALADEGIHENVVLDLSKVTVISQEAVRFLAHSKSIELTCTSARPISVTGLHGKEER